MGSLLPDLGSAGPVWTRWLGGGLRAVEGQAPGGDAGPGTGGEAAVLEVAGARPGQGHDGVGGGVAELEQGLGAEVGDVIAGLVVAGVVGHAGGAAVDGRLLRGLDALGAAEQAAGGDPLGDGWAVVGPAVEGRRLGGQPLAGEVVVEQALDLADPGGPSGPPAEPSPS